MTSIRQCVLSSLLLAFATSSCKDKDSSPKSVSGDTQAGLSPKPKETKKPIPDSDQPATKTEIVWIENDFENALALAKKEKKALLIDMWADWCHTCLAMKKGVLRDPGLTSLADDFVWLSVDTEDPSSAEVMRRFPPAVWPTFFVVSSEGESVQATQRGSSSVREFREFLERGNSGHRTQLEAGGQLGKDSPLYHLREADRAVLAGNWQAAAASYEQAAALGGRDWNYAAATQKNRISMLSKIDDKKGCAAMASDNLSSVAKARSSASTDFIYYASTCAKGAGDTAAQTQYRKTLLTTLDEILAAPQASLSVDDRSDSLSIGREISEELGDKEMALGYAHTQQKLLADAIASAKGPMEEMTYIWHQVSLHDYLGEGEKVLPWVESLISRLPKEYDPPYRHAWLLLKLKRHVDALAAINTALPLVQGARKGRVLSLQADIYKAQDSPQDELAARRAVVAHYKSLAPGLVKMSTVASAEKALAALSGK